MDFPSAVQLGITALGLPALFVWRLTRTPHGQRRRGWLWATAALGMMLAIPTAAASRVLAHWTVDDTDVLTNHLFEFLVAAPLAEGLTVAAVVPAFRSRAFRTPMDGMRYPAAAAAGFSATHGSALLWTATAPSYDLVRAVLSLAGQLAFALLWGYALGSAKRKRIGGLLFGIAFLSAVVFGSVYEHLVVHRPPQALFAAAPLLLFVCAAVALGARELDRRAAAPPTTPQFLRSFRAPSLSTMREALRRSERPVMISWIAFGALVTAGVITASLGGAVALGHQVGVDFAAVDRSDAGMLAMVPLALLGIAALLAFPFAGFLVARASATRTVLEPALSAAVAIVGSLVLLGLAAPLAVVFAIACAPIAFVLACVGAWVGLAR